jgi:hypothetical protein
MNKLANRFKHLLQEMVAPTIFFFISFQLLAFTRALILNQYTVEIPVFVAATFGALVVAKVVLVVNMLPFMNRFPGRPLIYNVAWKTPIYLLAAFVVRYLEQVLHFYRTHGTLVAVNRQLLDEVNWPRFWVIQLWLAVLLVIYLTMAELVAALGRGRARALFFGASRKAAGAPGGLRHGDSEAPRQ